MPRPQSATTIFERACQLIPGGVNSPVRAARGVDAHPVIAARAKGSKVWDCSGAEYIDYIGSWGPALFGHAHREIVAAVRSAAKDGLSFGLLTDAEVELAEIITQIVPSVEMVRLVCSGTEATMSALRLARAATKRQKVLIFDGCYHGHGDAFLAGGGSGMATLGIPKGPGVTEGVVSDTIVVPYNDLDAVREAAKKYGKDLAAIFVEPIAGNMGLVPPDPGFLEGLREVCDSCGSLLVFDEVMTGFRVSRGGAQELLGVMPDLTTMGKIIGGGLPIAAYGGKKKIMMQVAPAGPVYQAGTLAGNPLATAAAIATLALLRDNDVYTKLEQRCSTLQDGLEQALKKSQVTGCVQRAGSMLTMFFHPGPVRNFADSADSDHKRFGAFWRGMCQKRILLPPSGYECWFVSTTHTNHDIHRTIKSAEEVLSRLVQGETYAEAHKA